MAVECKRVFVIIGLIGLCFFVIPIRVDRNDDTAAETLFKDFMQKFNRTYMNNRVEYAKRFSNFKESLNRIERLNNMRSSNQSALYGLTKYSDLSEEEFLEKQLQPTLYERIKINELDRFRYNHPKYVRRNLPDDLPMRVDWREKKVVTPVQNQKTCGACWAFSTAETVESMYAIRKGVLKSLSVQELIDCAGNGNLGCEGGDTCSLLEWLVDKKISIELDTEYPLAWKTQLCKLKGSEKGITIAANFTCEYLVGSENVILTLLAHHGPVAVSVNAINWQNYLGGIIQFHCDGGLEHINHAVQIVGYDRNPPIPHYIVRNSWGPEFGDNGYLYIGIGTNLCGVATQVSALDIIL